MANDLALVKAGMLTVYEENAEAFDSQRDKSLFEKGWLDRFSGFLKPGAKIADIGCGTGEPITRYFIERHFSVTGVDYAAAMIKIAESRFAAPQWPNVKWHLGDIRSLDFDTRFDGIIAWHSFFHLSPNEQADTLPNILAFLKPGGVFMTTTGPSRGEAIGLINNKEVYHGSLDEADYKKIIEANGASMILSQHQDENCGGAAVFIAQKKR